jgi:hypothetical protein
MGRLRIERADTILSAMTSRYLTAFISAKALTTQLGSAELLAELPVSALQLARVGTRDRTFTPVHLSGFVFELRYATMATESVTPTRYGTAQPRTLVGREKISSQTKFLLYLS